MKCFRKFFLLCALAFVFQTAFAEDWEPTLFNNTKLVKVTNYVRDYCVKNGTYLSGTDDFGLYYLRGVNVYDDSIKIMNEGGATENSIIAIVYKNVGYYFKFWGRNYNGEGQINYSVVNVNTPVILFNYVTSSALNKIVITFDGTGFVANSIDSQVHFFPRDGESFKDFNEDMEFPYKYLYLQGKKVTNERESHYVRISQKRSDYNPKTDHLYSFFGIEGVKYLNDVYFQTVITDDDLRLRTSNSKNSNVIKLLSKGTEVRVLNIDPNITKMEDADGFWVLVETEERYIGWVWSGYLNKFEFDFK